MTRPDKLPRVLTEEETKRLLQQSNQRYHGPHRDHLYMRLMLYTRLMLYMRIMLYMRLMLKAGLRPPGFRGNGASPGAHRSHEREAHGPGGKRGERPNPVGRGRDAE
jgi:hypothetical protein